MLSINGGGAGTGYHLSYGYLNQDGLVVSDPFSSNRHNLRLRVNTELLDRIKVDGNLSYSSYFRQDAAAGGTAGVFRLSQRISPLLPVKWYKYEQGNKVPTDVYSYGAVNNPINVATNSGYNQVRSKIPTANLSATVNIVKGLDLFTQYAFRETTEYSKIYNTPVYRYGIDGSEFSGNASIKNSITSGNASEIYQNFTSTLGYDLTFGKHSVKALAGYSQEWMNGSTLSGFRTKIIDGTEVLNNGTEEFSNSGTENHWALRSYFGRLNYNYEEKYLFEANLRRDGTSRFSKANRWGVFPSFSVGWSLNKEKFMDFASPLFQQIKFRASFGTLGNQNVGEFHPYLTPITSYLRAYPIGLANNVAYFQSSIGNSDIHWETVEVGNAGLDVLMFRNRLSITAEWFVKNNKDALLKPAYPSVIGLINAAALPYANVGKVQSKGWELAVSWKDKLGEFGYGLDAMLSDVKNTVKSLGGNDPTLGDNIFRVGDPLYAYYGYQTDGLAQVSDFTSYDESLKRYIGPNFATINSYTAITQPGDVKYRDISGSQGVPDGQINNLDKVVIGNPYPRFSYSLRGNMNWKNIDVAFFLQGIHKVDGYLYDEAIHAFINDYSIPQKIHLDRWTPTNVNASYPRLYYSQTHNREFSDYWIQNGSYLRVKNIQVGYTLPKSILSKINIERMRFYTSLENPFTITDYFYAFDPEIRSTSGDSYPQVKTISFGVNFILR
jgi:TonB-linked SusC/RagA family outer membrane protein